VKDENGDMLADSHNISNRWKNYSSQLLNVHSASDVRQIEIHTAEPLEPDPSPFEVEIAIAKLKRYKSPLKNIQAFYRTRRYNTVFKRAYHGSLS
jgi:hypothetical protein